MHQCFWLRIRETGEEVVLKKTDSVKSRDAIREIKIMTMIGCVKNISCMEEYYETWNGDIIIVYKYIDAVGDLLKVKVVSFEHKVKVALDVAKAVHTYIIWVL